MHIKILIPILVSMLSVFCIPAYGQNAARSLGVSVELRDEIRNSYIFVFKDTVSPSRETERPKKSPAAPSLASSLATSFWVSADTDCAPNNHRHPKQTA